MDQFKPMHFENLWEDSELTSSQRQLTKQDIINNIYSILQDYLNIDDNNELNINAKDNNRNKLFGELLFNLSQLSMIDKINVFAALNMTNEVKKICNLQSIIK